MADPAIASGVTEPVHRKKWGQSLAKGLVSHLLRMTLKASSSIPSPIALALNPTDSVISLATSEETLLVFCKRSMMRVRGMGVTGVVLSRFY